MSPDLRDDGVGADRVARDGSYSAYFIDLPWNSDSTRYSLSCQAAGTEESAVVEGEAGQGPCCGSQGAGPDTPTRPTGQFRRAAAGGVVRVGNLGRRPANPFPPGRVTDLSLAGLNFSSGEFELSFTFPGADLDTGTVAVFSVLYSTNRTELATGDGTPLNTSQLVCGGDAECELEVGPPHSLSTLTLDMNTFPADQQFHFMVG